MRSIKGSKSSSKQAAAGSSSGHASARSASQGSSKALGVGVVEPLLGDDTVDYPAKLLSSSTSSAAPSPRSTAPGSGAASPLPRHGGGAAHDPDTPKSRLLHSVMGALEAYASSAADVQGAHPHPPALQQPYHMHHHHQPPSSSASSSPARARSGV